MLWKLRILTLAVLAATVMAGAAGAEASSKRIVNDTGTWLKIFLYPHNGADPKNGSLRAVEKRIQANASVLVAYGDTSSSFVSRITVVITKVVVSSGRYFALPHRQVLSMEP